MAPKLNEAWLTLPHDHSQLAVNDDVSPQGDANPNDHHTSQPDKQTIQSRRLLLVAAFEECGARCALRDATKRVARATLTPNTFAFDSRFSYKLAVARQKSATLKTFQPNNTKHSTTTQNYLKTVESVGAPEAMPEAADERRDDDDDDDDNGYKDEHLECFVDGLRLVSGAMYKIRVPKRKSLFVATTSMPNFDALPAPLRLSQNYVGGLQDSLLASDATHAHEVPRCELVMSAAGEACLACPLIAILALVVFAAICDSFFANKRFHFAKRRQGHSRKLTRNEPANTIIHTNQTEANQDDNNTANRQTPTQRGRQPCLLSNKQQLAGQSKHLAIVKKRLASVDAFRGLTIAAMILVNYGGAGYAFLEHSPWHGLTFADCVFPFFVFVSGVSIALSFSYVTSEASFSSQASSFLSFSKQNKQQPFACIAWNIVFRSMKLVALGVCLNSRVWSAQREAGARVSLHSTRLAGVLQRLGVSYAGAGLAHTAAGCLSRWPDKPMARGVGVARPYKLAAAARIGALAVEPLVALLMLAGYLAPTYLWRYSSAPLVAKRRTCPAGYLGPGGDTEAGEYRACTGGAAAALDTAILGSSHLYADSSLTWIFNVPNKVRHDPEGLLGCSTSILLAMLGVQCGKALLLATTPTFKSLADDLSSNNNNEQTLHADRQETPRVVVGTSTSKSANTTKAAVCTLVGWLSVCVLAALLSLCVFGIPINKKLWSLSFVLATGALAIVAQLVLFALIDVSYKQQSPTVHNYSQQTQHHAHDNDSLYDNIPANTNPLQAQSSNLVNKQRKQRLNIVTQLFVAAGKNSILIYLGHALFEHTLPWYFPVLDEACRWQVMFRLAWAIMLWLLVAMCLDRKRIYLKI